jgi:cytochrome c
VDARNGGGPVRRGPDVVVPGTTMPVQRVEEAGDLAALLRFLEETTR